MTASAIFNKTVRILETTSLFERVSERIDALANKEGTADEVYKLQVRRQTLVYKIQKLAKELVQLTEVS